MDETWLLLVSGCARGLAAPKQALKRRRIRERSRANVRHLFIEKIHGFYKYILFEIRIE